MRRRTITLTAAIVSAGLLASGGMLAAAIEDASVTIDNFTFSDMEITVAPGTKVTWENRDDIPHTVTDAAANREFKSPALDTGDTFSHVFSAPGTYRYFCSLHPKMQGTVVVK